MNAFIDIHHHVLYGLDDGPPKRADMERMLDAAWREGVRVIIATPHVSPGLAPFSPETIERRAAEAQAYCRAVGYDMRVLPGAEMLYTYQADRYLAQGRIPTLGGSDKLLMEFSLDIRYEALETAVQNVLRSGLVPVLAHIERYPCLMRSGAAEQLKEDNDVFYQVNADTVLTGAGFRVNRMLKRLLAQELIDFVASDAHDTQRRPCRMSEAYERLVATVGRPYADHLTCNQNGLSQPPGDEPFA